MKKIDNKQPAGRQGWQFLKYNYHEKKFAMYWIGFAYCLLPVAC